MSIAKTARIHPTAVIDPEADLGEDVQVGPFVVIEGAVRIGPGCVLKAGAHLIGPLTMGANNVVHSYAVLGDDPQHLKYRGEPSSVEIGDENIFREYVTIHRSANRDGVTRVGHRNFLMACSHVGHDCILGNNCIFANSSVLGGHCVIADNVCMSGNSATHQFCRIGRLAMISGISATSVDLPPFMINQRINVICGVNVVGMRRAGISHASIDAVRRAYHVLYRSQNTIAHSLGLLEKELGEVPEISELIAFIRASKRGITLNTERNAA